jgi:hypothetical protein
MKNTAAQTLARIAAGTATIEDATTGLSAVFQRPNGLAETMTALSRYVATLPAPRVFRNGEIVELDGDAVMIDLIMANGRAVVKTAEGSKAVYLTELRHI